MIRPMTGLIVAGRGDGAAGRGPAGRAQPRVTPAARISSRAAAVVSGATPAHMVGQHPGRRSPRSARRAPWRARSSRWRSRRRRPRSTSRGAQPVRERLAAVVVRPSKPEYAAACSPLRKIASKGCGSRLGWNASPSVPTRQCTGHESTKSGSRAQWSPGSTWWSLVATTTVVRRRVGRPGGSSGGAARRCRAATRAPPADGQRAALAEVVLHVDDDQRARHGPRLSGSGGGGRATGAGSARSGPAGRAENAEQFGVGRLRRAICSAFSRGRRPDATQAWVQAVLHRPRRAAGTTASRRHAGPCRMTRSGGAVGRGWGGRR